MIGHSEPELCIGSYRVERALGTVFIFAFGVHRTSGHHVFLRRDPGDEFPPRFSLWHVHLEAPALHALTPFAACASFQTMHEVGAILITDAAGTHRVDGVDVPATLLAHRA
jgi:hypothetical protein